MSKDHFSIIGGGIAGLAAAIAVSKTGRSVTIFEKASKFEHAGAGLQLGPNAARALKKIGAWEAVVSKTFAPPAIHIRDGQTGNTLKILKLDAQFEATYGEKYRVAHRADLHAALLEVAAQHKNIDIRLGQDMQMADWRSSGPVIGADGVWSSSRANLFKNSNAIIAKEKFFRSQMPSPEIAGISMDCVNLWLCPQGHVVHYPLNSAGDLNLVAITNGTPPESFFENSAPPLQKLIAHATHWTEWPATYVKPLKSWSFKNYALLIGDAAHGTLPYMAQGAAMALEDAATLGDILATENNFESAFATFYQQRASRTKRLHQASLNAGRIYHFGGLAATTRNIAMRMAPDTLMANRLGWIYRG